MEKLGDTDQKSKNRTLYNSREFMKSYYKTGPRRRDPIKEFNVNVIISSADKNSKSSEIKINDEQG